jgi:hypothetical protein
MLVELRIVWVIASARRLQSQRLARRNTCRRLYHRFARRNTCRRLSQLFACHNARRSAHWMAHCFRSLMVITTVCTPQFLSNSSSESSSLPLLNGNHNGLGAAILVDGYHNSLCAAILVDGYPNGLSAELLDRWLSRLPILPLLDGFNNGLRAVLDSRWGSWVSSCI